MRKKYAISMCLVTGINTHFDSKKSEKQLEYPYISVSRQASVPKQTFSKALLRFCHFIFFDEH